MPGVFLFFLVLPGIIMPTIAELRSLSFNNEKKKEKRQNLRKFYQELILFSFFYFFS